MIELARRGLADLSAALKLKGVWWALASEDIVDAHRRTRLGPVWQLLSYLLFVGTLVVVLGGSAGPISFAAYVASGMLVWLFISDVLAMSVTLFTRESAFIKGTVLPVSVYVLRQSAVIAIRSFYALLGAVAILLYTGVELTPAILSILPAIVVLLLTAPAVAVLLGVAGAYFPDLQFVVTNVLRLLMFITPIFWLHHDMGGVLGFLYYWNPLTHYIEIVRWPLIQGAIPTRSWIVVICITVVLLAAALPVLGKFRRQVVFQL